MQTCNCAPHKSYEEMMQAHPISVQGTPVVANFTYGATGPVGYIPEVEGTKGVD